MRTNTTRDQRAGRRIRAAATAGLLAAGCEMELGSHDDPSLTPVAPAATNTPGDTIPLPPRATPYPPDYERETFTGGGCVVLPLSDGPGGFVSNPENLRRSLKIVFPNQFNNQISRVTVFSPDGKFFDELYRELPNEHDGRPRYYGRKPIGHYPANLRVRVLMLPGSPCHTVVLPNPQQRWD